MEYAVGTVILCALIVLILLIILLVLTILQGCDETFERVYCKDCRYCHRLISDAPLDGICCLRNDFIDVYHHSCRKGVKRESEEK